MNKNSNLVDITSTAERLGVSKATLRKWDSEGKLKSIRIGSRQDRRYKLEDIERFLAQGAAGNTAPNWQTFQKWVDHGNFWYEEGNILPMGVEIGLREMSQIGEWFQPGFNFCTFMFEKDYAHQVLSVPESIAHCEAQFKILHENPKKMDDHFKEWDLRVEKLEWFMDRISFIALEKLPLENLTWEFQSFNALLADFWNISLTVEPYSPFLDGPFYASFEKAIGDSKKAKELFPLLTQPSQSSFISESRKDLLKIAIQFLHSPAERKKLLETPIPDYLAEIKRTNPDFFEALHLHQQKYFWLQNNYVEWTILTIQNFVQFLKELLQESSATDWKGELERTEDFHIITRQQEKLISEFKIPKALVDELKLIQKVSWYKDERKRVIFEFLHTLYSFLYEFSRRTGLDYKLITYASVDEIPALLQQKFPVETLHKRRNLCFYVSQEGRKHGFVIGNEAELLKEQLFKPHEEMRMESMHGTVASRGPESVVYGKVKVILNPKDQTISTDEILVTSMTRPEFVPLMKNAKAFITNEGGITCHAAIVSREMNKACIIGTQNATKNLKTGDEVEMRMNHGIISIKKRANP